MASSDAKHRDRGDRQSEPPAGLLPGADTAVPDLSEVYVRLQREIESERGLRAFLRSRSTPARVALAGLAVLALSGLTAAGWLRVDHAVYPFVRMAIVLFSIAALIAIDLLLTLRPLHRAPLAGWVRSAVIGGGFVGLAAVYALPAAHQEHPASLHASGLAELLRGAVGCLGIGLLLALAVHVFVRALDRGGVDRTLLAAASAGLAANLALQLHCPITLPGHLLAGHLGAAVLFVAAVALHGRGRGG